LIGKTKKTVSEKHTHTSQVSQVHTQKTDTNKKTIDNYTIYIMLSQPTSTGTVGASDRSIAGASGRSVDEMRRRAARRASGRGGPLTPRRMNTMQAQNALYDAARAGDIPGMKQALLNGAETIRRDEFKV
jgi:hypothetical protein